MHLNLNNGALTEPVKTQHAVFQSKRRKLRNVWACFPWQHSLTCTKQMQRRYLPTAMYERINPHDFCNALRGEEK